MPSQINPVNLVVSQYLNYGLSYEIVVSAHSTEIACSHSFDVLLDMNVTF